MKIISLLLYLLVALPAFACTEEHTKKSNVFARVIQKDSTGVDLAVFYPKEIKNAKLSSVSFSYFKGKEFILSVNAKIDNSAFGFTQVDLEKYSSSYIAIKEKELKNISITIFYSWPPEPDGTLTLCGPTENHRLFEIIENV